MGGGPAAHAPSAVTSTAPLRAERDQRGPDAGRHERSRHSEDRGGVSAVEPGAGEFGEFIVVGLDQVGRALGHDCRESAGPEVSTAISGAAAPCASRTARITRT